MSRGLRKRPERRSPPHPMMSVVHDVGRLAEVRYEPPLALDELVDFMTKVRTLVGRATTPLLFCCDWRAVESFDATFRDTIVWIMRRDNPRIVANAILVKSDALYAQSLEIVRDAKSAARQVFRDTRSLAAWLDPKLTTEERLRKDRFLGETWLSPTERARAG